MEIIKQLKNSLLHREEVVISLESEVTPSNADATKTLAEKFKKPEENIVLEHIHGKFGSRIFKISAKIYDNAESKTKFETIPQKQRKKEAEEKAKAEEAKTAEAAAPTEQAPEAAPTEVKPEPKGVPSAPTEKKEEGN